MSCRSRPLRFQKGIILQQRAAIRARVSTNQPSCRSLLLPLRTPFQRGGSAIRKLQFLKVRVSLSMSLNGTSTSHRSLSVCRIDNSTLVVTTKAASVATTLPANAIVNEDITYANAEGNLTQLLLFAESYNILRVLSGMGGLLCWAEKQRAENMHSLFSEKSLRPVHLQVSC
jgi:hypothetical protein